MKTADSTAELQRRETAPAVAMHLLMLAAAGLALWAATCGLWDLQGPTRAVTCRSPRNCSGAATGWR